MRIGELARAAGTPVAAVRHYEEIGLFGGDRARSAGAHREFEAEDAQLLREMRTLKKLLGLSLDELRDMIPREAARAVRGRAWRDADEDQTRERVLRDALSHTEFLLRRVARRKAELEHFEAELLTRRRELTRRSPRPSSQQ